jgi:hypothetical protein
MIDSFGKCSKTTMNFYELFPKLPGKIGPVNISKTTMNCFQNYLENSTSSIFPLEIFPSSFGNVSCIENAFGTVQFTVNTIYGC